ncbi:hypothetical protein [Kordiimonas marina]|uniref:hypothetical protein n=1 Tax=Kordiimonas marina TaxID=2872312 RepID=UPI001FF10370|nr:hypothetical protein [Kordiimonas marina]MCJ9429933.1 hypothetical protein [Kordiimonas marina]
MAGTHEDIEDAPLPEDPVRDDFSSAEKGASNLPEDVSTDISADIADEKRLHLKAFDYWLGLKGDRPLPLFGELTPGGLAPYRTNALLLEFSDAGPVVRFIGDKVSILIDAPIMAGTNLSDFPNSTFAQALIGQLADEVGRATATEFEFVEDLLDCRGIMLPFSRDGAHANFVMVVTNFRRREGLEHGESFVLDDLRMACERAARDVVHLDGGSRDSLYEALSRALALYEEGRNNPAAYQAMLAAEGLKVQARAPFTPALKLTFGKDYDKTRLTEYAAALSCAARAGKSAATLVAFLKAVPGGIKGCVQQERAERRKAKGTALHAREEAMLQAARTAKPVKLQDIKTEDEFCLILGRRNKDGAIELLGTADAGDGTTERVLRRFIQQKP